MKGLVRSVAGHTTNMPTCSKCGYEGHNKKTCQWEYFKGQVANAKANFAYDTADEYNEEIVRKRLDECYIELIEYCRAYQAWGAKKGRSIDALEVNYAMNGFPVYNMRGVMIQPANTSTLDIRTLDPRWVDKVPLYARVYTRKGNWLGLQDED